MAAHRYVTLIVCALAIAAAIVPCSNVSAAVMLEDARLIQVTATSGGYSATFEEVYPAGSFSGLLEDSWDVIQLTDTTSGVPVATLEDMVVSYQESPQQVSINFVANNSSQVDDVYIHVVSSNLIFGYEIPNAAAKAWASVAITDVGGTPDYVSVQNAGTLPPDKLYQARYSTDPIVSTNTVFASLIDEFDHDFGLTVEGRQPAVDYSPLGSSAYMMQAEFEFVLSAGDKANCGSNFRITPEPGTLSILSLGVMALLRRRD